MLHWFSGLLRQQSIPNLPVAASQTRESGGRPEAVGPWSSAPHSHPPRALCQMVAPEPAERRRYTRASRHRSAWCPGSPCWPPSRDSRIASSSLGSSRLHSGMFLAAMMPALLRPALRSLVTAVPSAPTLTRGWWRPDCPWQHRRLETVNLRLPASTREATPLTQHSAGRTTSVLLAPRGRRELPSFLLWLRIRFSSRRSCPEH